MTIELENKVGSRTRLCPMYKVIMHNDDITTMEFVVMVLMTLFQKNTSDAIKIMLEIHNNGQGLAGVYALEHAELRVEQTHSFARAQKFPLTCTIEPA